MHFFVSTQPLRPSLHSPDLFSAPEIHNRFYRGAGSRPRPEEGGGKAIGRILISVVVGGHSENMQGEKSLVKVDDALSRMMREWLSGDGFANDMAEAKKRSLEPNPEQQAKKLRLVKLMNERLAVHNRKREPTTDDGNCQFIAVARVFGLPDDSHRQLREDVVDYFIKNREEFEGFSDSFWDAYIAYMSTVDVGWGDHVTLTI